jgi:hypothetical protein
VIKNHSILATQSAGQLAGHRRGAPDNSRFTAISFGSPRADPGDPRLD